MKKQFWAVMTAVVLVMSLATTAKAVSADYNHDGDIDGSDLQQFVADFQAGVVDSNDLADFASLYGQTNLSASLVLMVATGMDKVEMAWIPGSDRNTPEEAVKYDIHLSTTEDFIPDASTLKQTVNGENQAEVTGLTSGTLYYGKVVAIYTGGISSHSNSLHTGTYPFPVELDPTTVISDAAALGLGKHTTDDGINYTYSGGTPPQVGSVLFSEDIAGGMTIRTVESVSSTGGTVSVVTSDASLTDVVDGGAVYTSMKLVDLDGATGASTSLSKGMATLKTSTRDDGSFYKRMDWKEKLLCAEQTIYAHDDADFSVQPKGNSSIIKLGTSQDGTSKFEAKVTAKFEPDLITSAEWGGGIFKHLDAAKVEAKGKLTLEAIAQYNFSAEDTYENTFPLWDNKWTILYTPCPTCIPVYQEIILTIDVEATASAFVEVKAVAQGSIIETVTVGAIYDGFTWSPYITHDEYTDFAASLNILGKANGEIRLIPMIEVKFYKVISAGLSVEPFVGSRLTFEELAAHPTRLIQLTSFDASLGLEANIESSLSGLGLNWEVLPSTCVLGTSSCLYTFDEQELFSIPALELTTMSACEESAQLRLQVTDGTHNRFKSDSVNWEVFPDDGVIQPGACSTTGEITTCSATFTPGLENEYTVFASGHGVLGEMGRQFKELTIYTEDQNVIPATVTLSFQGTGSGVKECSGEWGYQRVTFNQEISFEVEGVNPVKSGDIVTYDLSKKNGTIHFYGTAEDLFGGDKTTLNFDREQTISIENTEGIFQCSTTSPDSEYIGFLIPHSSTLPYSTSIEYFGWIGTVRNAVNMPQPWNYGVGCIYNVYDVPGTDDNEGCLSQ